MRQKTIHVEVAYATPNQQKLIRFEVDAGTNALQAIELSGIKDFFPNIDPGNCKVGIFGKVLPKPAGYELREGDRVEIYRPLKIDPKQARLNRARKTKDAT